MLGLKIGLTAFAVLILVAGIIAGVKKENKVIMIIAIVFAIALSIVTWLTVH